MATILQTSDFAIGEYKVPNQEEVDFAEFLTDHQARVLKDLLGIDFYNAFIAGLDAGTVLQKWTDLKDGEEYTYSDRTYEYAGMVDLLKPIIFSRWIHHRTQKLTSAGIISTTPQNANLEGPGRIIGKYNAEYFRKAGDWDNHRNTLFGFLYANRDTYTEWDSTEWCPKGRVNMLGL